MGGIKGRKGGGWRQEKRTKKKPGFLNQCQEQGTVTLVRDALLSREGGHRGVRKEKKEKELGKKKKGGKRYDAKKKSSPKTKKTKRPLSLEEHCRRSTPLPALEKEVEKKEGGKDKIKQSEKIYVFRRRGRHLLPPLIFKSDQHCLQFVCFSQGILTWEGKSSSRDKKEWKKREAADHRGEKNSKAKQGTSNL